MLQVIEYIARQLYYVNPADHCIDGEIVVLPYIDDFKTLREISQDIDNEGDYNLIEHEDWEYDEVRTEAKTEKTNTQQKPENQPEQDTDDDENDSERS